MSRKNTEPKIGACCGVPQCKSYKSKAISMHTLPKRVLNNPDELLKWKHALKIEKPFSKCFVICSLHFKDNEIIVPINRGQSKRTRLVDSAFPTLNLPKSAIVTKKCTKNIKVKYERLNRMLQKEPTSHSFVGPSRDVTTNRENLKSCVSIGIQASISQEDKSTEVIEQNLYYLPFSFDSAEQLKTITGIASLAVLDTFVKLCETIRSGEHSNLGMPLKNRILLTMCKLKHNLSNAMIANMFRISEKTTNKYFADTIQLLANVLDRCILWQTREENQTRLPACFAKFPNTVTVLDCTEIKTVKFDCVKRRTGTYSRYKGTNTVKLVIGVSPSGLVNFISLAASGRTSNQAIFNLTDLAKKLKPGDAVMVDKGFLIANKLQQLGVQIIRPQFMRPGRTKEDVESDRQIASARVYVKRRIARIKTFKILSETVKYSNLQYLDDIIKVICVISNLSSPILNDNEFV